MTAPVAEPTETDQGTPTGWRGPIAPVNTWSGDGRMLVLADGAELSVRPLPLPIKAQLADADGHLNSVLVGLMTRAWIEDAMVWGEGPFDLADLVAREWADKVGRGMAGWVSIDPSDVKVEQVLIDPDGNEIPPDAFPDDPDAPEDQWPVVADIRERYTEWRLMGVTLVSSPAFEAARIAPVWEEFEPVDAEGALTAAAGVQTGAMIALVPDQPDRFAVDGGDPAPEMHLTLAYLGEAIDWPDDARTALLDALTAISGSPVEANVFGHAILNPGSAEPATVHLVGDAPDIDALRLAVLDVLDSTPELPGVPEQHQPFLPHITAGYSLPVADLTYTGPVTFGAIRVAFAGVAVDIPLGEPTPLAASGDFTWSWEAFHMPEPDRYTSLTTTPDGRVYGHLGEKGVCHTGIANACVMIPPSPSGYRKFHRKPITTDRGEIEAGILTMDTSHAPVDPRLGLSPESVVRHYDHTGKFAAMVRVIEGRIGPWVCGQVAPWTDPMDAVKLGHCYMSGDWRGAGGSPRDLRAVLAVNNEGFPEKSRAIAASGAAGEALVAAGIPPDAPRRAGTPDPRPEPTKDQIRGMFREFVGEVLEERERDARLRKVDTNMKTVRVALASKRIGV